MWLSRAEHRWLVVCMTLESYLGCFRLDKEHILRSEQKMAFLQENKLNSNLIYGLLHLILMLFLKSVFSSPCLSGCLCCGVSSCDCRLRGWSPIWVGVFQKPATFAFTSSRVCHRHPYLLYHQSLQSCAYCCVSFRVNSFQRRCCRRSHLYCGPDHAYCFSHSWRVPAQQ